ncbi:MAG: hypothetical protein N2439_08105 [Anaerolineae bacterium]|nr:hypothetical protein [Anaerolineae bacterium]
MERKWDPRLDELGARLEAPAEAEYRLVEARWVGPDEAGDKRLIYVRVLDENGTPQEGRPYRIINGGERIERTKSGGFDQFWGNYPMFAPGPYAVDIPGATSDRISNLPRGTKDNPGANTCYYLVFQYRATVTPPAPTPTPQPPPTPPAGPPPGPEPPSVPPAPGLNEETRRRLLALLDQAQSELEAARKLLEG